MTNFKKKTEKNIQKILEKILISKKKILKNEKIGKIKKMQKNALNKK